MVFEIQLQKKLEQIQNILDSSKLHLDDKDKECMGKIYQEMPDSDPMLSAKEAYALFLKNILKKDPASKRWEVSEAVSLKMQEIQRAEQRAKQVLVQGLEYQYREELRFLTAIQAKISLKLQKQKKMEDKIQEKIKEIEALEQKKTKKELSVVNAGLRREKLVGDLCTSLDGYLPRSDLEKNIIVKLKILLSNFSLSGLQEDQDKVFSKIEEGVNSLNIDFRDFLYQTKVKLLDVDHKKYAVEQRLSIFLTIDKFNSTFHQPLYSLWSAIGKMDSLGQRKKLQDLSSLAGTLWDDVSKFITLVSSGKLTEKSYNAFEQLVTARLHSNHGALKQHYSVFSIIKDILYAFVTLRFLTKKEIFSETESQKRVSEISSITRNIRGTFFNARSVDSNDIEPKPKGPGSSG